MGPIAFLVLAVIVLALVVLVRNWHRSCEKRYTALLGDPGPDVNLDRLP